MANLTIDKDKFLELLDQFKNDIPYEHALIDRIFTNMPHQAVECIIEEMYFKHLYKGPVYRAVHYIFKDDIHLFANQECLIEFLKSRDLEKPEEFWKTVDGRLIRTFIERGNPICGYIITKDNL